MLSEKLYEVSGFVCFVIHDSIDRASEVRWTQAFPASGDFTLPSPNGATHPAKPRLLIVDDDRDLCSLVARYLEPEGFALSAVYTGADGVKSATEIGRAHV